MALAKVGGHPGHAVVDEIHVAVGAEDDAPHEWRAQGLPEGDGGFRIRSSCRCGGGSSLRGLVGLFHQQQEGNQPKQTARTQHQEHGLPAVRFGQIGGDGDANGWSDLGAGHIDSHCQAAPFLLEVIAYVAEAGRGDDRFAGAHQKP